MIRFILGTLAVFGTFLFAYWLEGGSMANLVMPSPLIITIGMPLFATLAVWDRKSLGAAWKDAFVPAPDPVRRARSARVWDLCEKVCYASAFIGTMAGFIIILSSWNRSADSLALSFSVACVAPLNAVLFALVARILRFRVTREA